MGLTSEYGVFRKKENRPTSKNFPSSSAIKENAGSSSREVQTDGGKGKIAGTGIFQTCETLGSLLPSEVHPMRYGV